MGNVIITYNEISDLNHFLENENIPYKVHLHDTCGKQSFTLEALDEKAGEFEYSEMKKAVIEFFKNKGNTISFIEKGHGFVIL